MMRTGFAWLLPMGVLLAMLAGTSAARADDAQQFNRLAQQCDSAVKARKYPEAEQTARKLQELAEGPLRAEELYVGDAVLRLGRALRLQGRFTEAEPLYQRSLAISEKKLGPDHPGTAVRLYDLARLYQAQARYAEAEPLFKRCLEIREKKLGPDHPETALTVQRMAALYYAQGRYTEAEPFYKRNLQITEKKFGPDDINTAASLIDLTVLYRYQGRYAEAVPLVTRSLQINEKKRGPDHPATAASLNYLASIYRNQGRYAEAEPLYKRALEIYEKKLGSDHPTTSSTLIELALLYDAQGHYAEAEPLLKRSLEIREKKLGLDDPFTADSLHHLAALYQEQGRFAEAEPLYKRSLQINEKKRGVNHPKSARDLDKLAEIYREQGRYAETEPLLKRSLQIREKEFGPDHHFTADSLHHVAAVYQEQGRYAEAEPLYKRALEIYERKLGPDHPTTASSLQSLAALYYAQSRYADAEPLVERSVSIRDRAGVAPGARFESYLLRARVSWKQDRRDEAVRDLQQAMLLAEQQRSQTSGGEQERAERFSGFSTAFEQMLAWQLELKGPGEALSAMERARARSLLDEMQQTGVDLGVGRSAPEREALKRRELELTEEVARREKQLEALAENPAGSPSERQQRSEELQAGMSKARAALYEFYRDERSSSPVYRNLLSTGGGPPRLSRVQRQLVGKEGLLLAYLLGEENGYLLAVSADKAMLTSLALDEASAKALEVKPGPLTAKRLSEALINSKDTGVVQLLRDPKRADEATAKLAMLWQALVPAAQRAALSGGKLKRLLVVPDGQLALLPFEALVVKPGPRVQYLVDVGPPIQYGPSATVLYNLAERLPGVEDSQREPILSVGNPDYSGGSQIPAKPDDVLSQVAVSARYGASGGKLAALPFTAWESAWVAESFQQAGVKTKRLEGAAATKAKLWEELAGGRRIVHLACHGLAEQSYGNLFGALALAPGKAGSADDGFLTLREIYQLNLKGCELAILSACETNCGPQQQGEGVWALSRGFLVAGARRVVASNWLVDDEAGATLVSYFCGALAQAQKQGQTADYAEALQRAKRSLRHESKWRSPYYWASLVLVGPN
jgi:CHAT domain-containing protein